MLRKSGVRGQVFSTNQKEMRAYFVYFKQNRSKWGKSF